MSKEVFILNNRQLQEISRDLYDRVLTGLKENDTEIRCIPTYIFPEKSGISGKALALDLGGTNCRAAVVRLSEGEKPAIYPENGLQKDLSVMRTEGYTEQQLFQEIAGLISQMDEKELPLGYCFSYPAESMRNGDAKLIRWTKGVNIDKMIGKRIGKTLLQYLNCSNNAHYTSVKVINDTVASLLAAISHHGYDAYIGLIVGTGANMATFVPAGKMEKLNKEYRNKGLIPVNLESGNFFPPYLTHIDDAVDAESENQGQQRFEKAVSGRYLGEIFQKTFPYTQFGENFYAQHLTSMLNNPDDYKEIYIHTARAIYTRSANLVAAALKGLIEVLLSFNKDIKNICLTAEGSLFWSENRNGVNYEALVYTKLHELLKDAGLGDIRVEIKYVKNANLIGSAIAALS